MTEPTRTSAIGDTVHSEDGQTVAELLPGQTLTLVPPGIHVVHAGDTYWSLAQRYEVTVTDLGRWNPDVAPTAMPIGTLLHVTGDPAPPPDPEPGPVYYPADAGIVNVKAAPYNAKGDGTTDDAAAIRQAILDNDLREGQTSPVLNPFAARTVHLPPGTYRVGSSLAAVGSSVALAGAGETHTVIEAVGFTAGQYVLDPGSRLTSNQGNSGFANHIRHLTVDLGVGAGRGVRFDAANSGSMNHVTIRGGDVGIALETTTGPCMIADVTLDGCATGILADQVMPNNVVLCAVSVRGAGVACDNDSKNLTFEDWATEGCATVYRARSVNATVIVIGGKFTGGNGGAAFDIPAGAFVHLRDVELQGYSHIVPGVPVPADGIVKEWSTHPYRRGATAGPWAGDHVGLRLPSPRFPEPDYATSTGWYRVTAGPDLASSLRAADASGLTVAYLPYGRYSLTSDVTLRNVERIECNFAEIGGTGRLTLAPAAGKTMILENLSSALDVRHDGAGTVGLRHLGPIGGGGGAMAVATGPNATGDLFLEDWGPHANVTVDRPIRVHARQINREGVDWSISGGAVVRVLGDNCETDTGRGGPVVTVTDATAEYLGGTWDNLGDSTSYSRTGPAWLQAVRSTVGIVMPSLLRSGGVIGHWVSDDGVNITDAHLVKYPARGNDQRCAMPLYVSP